MVDVIGAYLVGKIGVSGRPQARRRSRRHGLRPCVSTQSKRPAAEMLRFAGICGGSFILDYNLYGSPPGRLR